MINGRCEANGAYDDLVDEDGYDDDDDDDGGVWTTDSIPDLTRCERPSTP